MVLDLDAYTFGIEIEFSNINRATAASIIAATLDVTTINYVSGTYYTHEVTANDGRIWRVMHDRSIVPIGYNNQEYRCELVTPILRYTADIDTLQQIVRDLRNNGAKVNSSCGCHVHVGADGHCLSYLS